jgi:hypothetical protein
MEGLLQENNAEVSPCTERAQAKLPICHSCLTGEKHLEIPIARRKTVAHGEYRKLGVVPHAQLLEYSVSVAIDSFGAEGEVVRELHHLPTISKHARNLQFTPRQLLEYRSVGISERV